MASGPHKQEDTNVPDKNTKIILDCTKEDGIRKELYKLERTAQENWERKWKFLKNPMKLWEEEAARRGLPSDIFERHRNKTSSRPEESPNLHNFSVERVPPLFSGMIGWRSKAIENNLNRIGGPMYVSRRLTMNPPLGPDEPDLNQQRFIILG